MSSRVHQRVHIYDTAEKQWQAPPSLVPRPTPSGSSKLASSADLEFNYQNSPFAFWITRRQGGDVLFDTRPANIPTYASPYNGADSYANSSAMPNQNLIFENQVRLSSSFVLSVSLT